MLIDTHCHLHDPEWFTAEQQADFLQSARQSDVQKIICIGTNSADSKTAHDFATQHENIYWTYGIHPEFANSIEDVSTVTLPPFQESLVAVGEIGLDYHYEGYDRSAQIRLFEQMLDLAVQLNLPVSLHIREAFDDAFGVLDNFPNLKGVVHSFTGSKKELKKVLQRNFYVGVNGLATYSTLPLPPLENMLLETDAPFLTPTPFRGKINTPGYVSLVADYLATTLNVPKTLIAEQTTKNATTLFKI